MQPRLLLLRAILSFLLLPGVAAVAFPLVIISFDPFRNEGYLVGFAPLIGGYAALLWCARDFYAVGRGTLAPWDPPRRLVAAGLYRFVRNPMYVSILAAVGGWSLVTGSPVLAVYTLLLAAAFHLRVLLFEEPWCARQFGQDWSRYAAAVPRWTPRLSPSRP